MVSLALAVLSGSPCDVMYLKPAKIITNSAIEPIKPKTICIAVVIGEDELAETLGSGQVSSPPAVALQAAAKRDITFVAII